MANGQDQEKVELRGESPRWIVDMLDAVSMSRSLNRMQLVNEILGEWVRMRKHEHTFIARVVRVHPPSSGGNGDASA